MGATAWLEMGGEKKPLVMRELGCADGCGRQVGRRIARTAADDVGAASLAARTAADGKWVGRIARTAADGVGAREWLEMGGEEKPLFMSELGCADGCGREMGAENCADGCGRRGCRGVTGNGWGEKTAGDERAWLRGCQGVAGNGWGVEAVGDQRAWLRRRPKLVERIARTTAESVGAREWLEMDGEEAAGVQRAWLRGRLRMANGWGELRGR